MNLLVYRCGRKEEVIFYFTVCKAEAEKIIDI